MKHLIIANINNMQMKLYQIQVLYVSIFIVFIKIKFINNY